MPQPSRTPVPSKCIFLCCRFPETTSVRGGATSAMPRAAKHLQPFCFCRCLQAFAALVPGVSQVDNSSDFLGKKPHRKHPGILSLPHIQLPQALADAAQLLLYGEKLREGEARKTKRGQHVAMTLSICDHRETHAQYREEGASTHQLSLEPTFTSRAGGVAKTGCVSREKNPGKTR